MAPGVERAHSGDLVTDLHAEVDLLCDRLRDRPVSAFLRALLAMADVDEAAVALRQRYVDDLVAPFRTLLADADLSEDARDDVLNWIVAPLLVDALLLDRPAARERAHRAVGQSFPKARVEERA